MVSSSQEQKTAQPPKFQIILDMFTHFLLPCSKIIHSEIHTTIIISYQTKKLISNLMFDTYFYEGIKMLCLIIMRFCNIVCISF